MTLRLSLLAAILFASSASPAQEAGSWRAVSTTARAITGDVAFTDVKLYLNFYAFTLAQIRTLTPAEIAAVFPAGDAARGAGNLFRTEIPGGKRFLHKNTLCGSEDTQWVATFVSGHTLQMALFSGNAIPPLTPEALANDPSLCGTFTYAR